MHSIKPFVQSLGFFIHEISILVFVDNLKFINLQLLKMTD
jgi:hypothetical protein